MEVNRPAVWLLIIVASVAGAAYMLYATLRASAGAAPLSRLARCGSAMLTGIGLGIAAASAVLIVAAIMTRLGP